MAQTQSWLPEGRCLRQEGRQGQLEGELWATVDRMEKGSTVG